MSRVNPLPSYAKAEPRVPPSQVLIKAKDKDWNRVPPTIPETHETKGDSDVEDDTDTERDFEAELDYVFDMLNLEIDEVYSPKQGNGKVVTFNERLQTLEAEQRGYVKRIQELEKRFT